MEGFFSNGKKHGFFKVYNQTLDHYTYSEYRNDKFFVEVNPAQYNQQISRFEPSLETFLNAANLRLEQAKNSLGKQVLDLKQNFDYEKVYSQVHQERERLTLELNNLKIHFHGEILAVELLKDEIVNLTSTIGYPIPNIHNIRNIGIAKGIF